LRQGVKTYQKVLDSIVEYSQKIEKQSVEEISPEQQNPAKKAMQSMSDSEYRGKALAYNMGQKTVGTTAVSVNDEINPTDIAKKWKIARRQIESEIKDLIPVARQVGVQLRTEIAENHPGTTTQIRRMWRKARIAVIRQMRQIEKASKKTGSRIANAFNPFRNGLKGVGTFVKDLALSFGAFAGLTSLGDTLSNLILQTTQFAIEVDTLKTGLIFSLGGATDVANKKFQELRESSDELGLSFIGTVETFKDLSSALMGTQLESQANDIFEGFQKAIAARGLGRDDQRGIFRGVGQIASKERVSLEELYQIAERLPGAFTAFSAAIGATKKEIFAMAEAGDLMASNFLVPLGDYLEKEAEEGGLAIAVQGAASQMQRIKNELEETQLAFGQIGVDFITSAAPNIISLLDSINKNMDLVKTGLKILAAFLSQTLIKSLVSVITNLNIFNGRLRAQHKAAGRAAAANRTLARSFVVLGAGVKKALAGLAIPIATIAVFETLWEVFNAGSETAKQNTKDIREELEQIQTLESRQNVNTPDKKATPQAKGFFPRQIDKTVNRIINFGSLPGMGRQAINVGRKALGEETIDPKEFNFLGNYNLSQTKKAIDESVQNANQIIQGALENNFERRTNQLEQEAQRLNQEINLMQAEADNFRSKGKTEEAKAVQEEIKSKQQLIITLRETNFQREQSVRLTLTRLKGQKEELKQIRQFMEEDEYQSRLSALNSEIAAAENYISAIESAIKPVIDDFKEIQYAIKAINREFANFEEQTTLIELKAQQNIKSQRLEGTLSEEQSTNASSNLEERLTKREIINLDQKLKELEKILNKNITSETREVVAKRLGVENLAAAGIGNIDTQLELAEGTEKEVLKILKEIKATKQERLKAENNLLDIEITQKEKVKSSFEEYKQSIKQYQEQNRQAIDLQRQIEDFNRSTEREARALLESFSDFQNSLKQQSERVRTGDSPGKFIGRC